MTTEFTPQLQACLMLAAVAIFGAAVYYTRATFRLGVAALISALIFAMFNILWDVAANHARWWWYPSIDQPFAPLAVYLAQDLVWGGALGLLGWRVQRRFGLRGLALFVPLLSLAGNLRDSLAATLTGFIVFGSGFRPRLLDLVCWATLLAVAQGTLRLAAGASYYDALPARPAKLRSKQQ